MKRRNDGNEPKLPPQLLSQELPAIIFWGLGAEMVPHCVALTRTHCINQTGFKFTNPLMPLPPEGQNYKGVLLYGFLSCQFYSLHETQSPLRPSVTDTALDKKTDKCHIAKTQLTIFSLHLFIQIAVNRANHFFFKTYLPSTFSPSPVKTFSCL